MMFPERSAEQTARDIALAVYRALRFERQITFIYTFADGYLYSASDLAKIEKDITGLVRLLLNQVGFNLKRTWKLKLNVAEMKHAEDGDNSVSVHLDFAKIVPGFRAMVDEEEKRRGVVLFPNLDPDRQEAEAK